MNKRWMNTNVSTAAEMTELTDGMTLEFSNGEVIFPSPCEEGDPVERSMTDPKIFGKMSDEETLMGHISLPIPIVNIQYLFGSRPILPRILGIPRKEIEKIVYYGAHVVIEPGETEARYKQIVEEKDFEIFHQEYPGAICLCGAEAIEALLKREHAPEYEHIILHCLPVIPLSLRYQKVERKNKKPAWSPIPMEYLYNRLILRIGRLAKLKALKAPEVIIRNESRMLQEYADTLINNGARGIPYITPFGCPAQSLQELYEIVSCPCPTKVKPVLPVGTYIDAVALEDPVNVLYPLVTDDADDCERDESTDEPYDPESDPVELAEEKIKALCHPFIEAVIKKNFSIYGEEFLSPMLNFAEESILAGIGNVNLEEPIEPQLLNGIFETIQMAMKKQSIYL